MTTDRTCAPRASARSGTILIVVAGMTSLLAAMALAFLARMRVDIEETDHTVADAQSRIMLLAACDYVLESGRLGWDAPATTTPGAANQPLKVHKEAFGWIDVRGRAPGAVPQPNDEDITGPRGPDDNDHDGLPDPFWSSNLVEDSDGDGAADRPAWPAIHSVARCPMYVMTRPPFATAMTAVYNPISVDAGPTQGYPYLIHPDPQPAGESPNFFTDAAPAATNDSRWADYVRGDPRPRQNSTNLSWFRVYREGIATFVLTCGTGGRAGFRDWGEVRGAHQEEQFNYDPAYFAQLQSTETRSWYRIEWSAATMSQDYYAICGDLERKDHERYMMYPPNASHTWYISRRTQLWNKNYVGTIQWVERLRGAPTNW